MSVSRRSPRVELRLSRQRRRAWVPWLLLAPGLIWLLLWFVLPLAQLLLFGAAGWQRAQKGRLRAVQQLGDGWDRPPQPLTLTDQLAVSELRSSPLTACSS